MKNVYPFKIIDNYKPYIRLVEIFVGGNLYQSQSWASQAGTLRYSETPPSTIFPSPFNNQIKIVITASEPLARGTVNFALIPENSAPLPTPTPAWSNIERTLSYTYTLPNNGVSRYCIRINGLDYARNQILALQNMPGYANKAIVLPSRNQQGGWQNFAANYQGNDETHCFDLGRCRGPEISPKQNNGNAENPPPPAQCLLADFDHSATYDGCGIAFRNTSLGNFTEANWYFGDGSTIGGTLVNSPSVAAPTHVYLENGCYDVVLSIRDGMGNTGSVTKKVCIERCGTPPDDPVCQINGPSLAGAGGNAGAANAAWIEALKQ